MNIPFLKNPSFVELDDAYRGMPKLGELHFGINADNIYDFISNLESIGYVGMKITRNVTEFHAFKIRAFKGKHGPCYNTGKTALYSGGAMAVLDDDNHLLFRNEIQPVCEKTAKIFQLTVYQGLVQGNTISPG